MNAENKFIVALATVSEHRSSLLHMLEYRQWLLRPMLCSLHEIESFLVRETYEKSLPEALLMNECVKVELYL